MGMAVISYHQQMIQLAKESLTRIDPFERSVSSVTMSLSRAQQELLKQKMEEFRKEAMQLSNSEGLEKDVVQLNLQMFRWQNQERNRTMNRFLILILAMLFHGCAIEVGNPHPVEPEKAGVKLDLEAEGSLPVDEVSLNLVGVKLIRKDAETENISFAASKQLSIAKGSETDAVELHKGSTNVTGNYSKVRLYFDKSEFGSVEIAGNIYPLTLTQQESFFDIAIDFSLKSGELTKIKLSLEAGKVVQAVTDSSGEVTGYQMSSEMNAEAENEVDSSLDETTTEAYTQYRIAIKQVNDGDQVNVRKLMLQVNDVWLKADTGDMKDVLNDGPVTSPTPFKLGVYDFNITASSNPDDAYKAFDPGGLFAGAWKSDEVFDPQNGVHAAGQAEYLTFRFAQAVEINGYEFSSDGGDNCALQYEMQVTSNDSDWFTIPGSQSALEACELVNVNW